MNSVKSQKSFKITSSGKVSGALRAIIPFLLLPLLHAGLLVVSGIITESGFWTMAVALLIFTPVYYLLGVYAGATRNMRRGVTYLILTGGALLFAPFVLTGFLLNWEILPEEVILKLFWDFTEFISPGPALYYGIESSTGQVVHLNKFMFWLSMIFYTASIILILRLLSQKLRKFLEWAQARFEGG